MKTKKVVDPAITEDVIEDKIEAGYQKWKSGLQDFLVIDEEEWETGAKDMHRTFYYTSMADPGEEPRPGTYAARMLDDRVQVIVDMGDQE